MKRSALGTIRLEKALVKQAIPVTARQLERWSIDGLGPLGTPEFRVLVHHYAAVASLSTVGRDADTVARRLATRGYACGRLRDAILREIGMFDAPPTVLLPVVDLSSEASDDAAFAALEQQAQAMMANTRGLPPLMVRLIRALYRNVAERCEQMGEPAEAIFHSFVVNGLAHLMGGDYYNGEAMEAAFGLEAGTVTIEMLDVINSTLRVSIADLDWAYRSVPVEEITFMAQRLAAWAPHLITYLKVTCSDPAEIEDLAVIFAPIAVHYVSVLRAAFDDFPDDALALVPPIPQLPAASSQ